MMRAVEREQHTCGRCPRCHPGKQWGGDEHCRVSGCGCHAAVTVTTYPGFRPAEPTVLGNHRGGHALAVEATYDGWGEP